MTPVADPYQPFHSILAAHAGRHPDKAFLHAIADDRAITYGALFATANRIASFLRERKFAANDRVMVLAGNSIEMVAAYFGVLRHGATVCTVNVEMNEAHLGEIVDALAPRLTLYEEGRGLERLADTAPGDWAPLGAWAEDGGAGFFADIAAFAADGETPPVCGPDDCAVIFYTSGTVAKPKGVIYSHRALYANFDAVADMVALGADDRLLDFRSFGWMSAQELGLGAPLVRGATAIMAERFSRRRYLEWLRDHDVTIGACMPAGIAMLLREPVDIRKNDLPHLRFMTSSSAPLLVGQWKAFEALYGIPVAQGYGMSEAGWITGMHEGNRRLGTVGRPLKYQTVRVLDPDGNEVAAGETGEIVVGGAQQATGYLLADGSIERLPAGALATGDLGHVDGDGYLRVTGRVKELIIRGGVNIAPLEIDGVIAELPGIAEACTIGVPDAIYGEEVVSFVALRPGAAPSAETILAHCRGRLPRFKMPKQVIFREALPRTGRDKLDRAALAADWKRMNADA